jgi:hypothetical protein
MISLKDQDEFEAQVQGIGYSSKRDELEAVIGQTYSDNYSSTGMSRLIEIMEDGYCVIEEVDIARLYLKGRRAERPDWLVWNGFFF